LQDRLLYCFISLPNIQHAFPMSWLLAGVVSNPTNGAWLGGGVRHSLLQTKEKKEKRKKIGLWSNLHQPSCVPLSTRLFCSVMARAPGTRKTDSLVGLMSTSLTRVLRRPWPPPRFGRIAGKFKSSQNSNSVLVSAGAEGGRLHLRCCLHECSQESDQNAVGGSSGTWPPGTQRLGFFFFSHGFLVSLCAQVSSCLLFAPPSQWIPEHKHWRLNERHYGALQGLDKAETAAKHGEEQVKIWRRAYATPPPALEKTDERFPGGAFLFFPVPLF